MLKTQKAFLFSLATCSLDCTSPELSCIHKKMQKQQFPQLREAMKRKKRLWRQHRWGCLRYFSYYLFMASLFVWQKQVSIRIARSRRTFSNIHSGSLWLFANICNNNVRIYGFFLCWFFFLFVLSFSVWFLISSFFFMSIQRVYIV